HRRRCAAASRHQKSLEQKGAEFAETTTQRDGLSSVPSPLRTLRPSVQAFFNRLENFASKFQAFRLDHLRQVVVDLVPTRCSKRRFTDVCRKKKRSRDRGGTQGRAQRDGTDGPQDALGERPRYGSRNPR